jgi:putative aminopeptidase FrvX
MTIRLFTDVIRDLRFGETLDEISTEFNKLVTAVENTGKAGSLTFTVKIKPSAAGAIEVIDEIKTKLPQLAKGTSLFFATPEGNLVRNNPRQDELPGLKEVPKNEKPLKEAKHG